MKIRALGPLTATLDLDPTDLLILADACALYNDQAPDRNLTEALRAALEACAVVAATDTLRARALLLVLRESGHVRRRGTPPPTAERAAGPSRASRRAVRMLAKFRVQRQCGHRHVQRWRAERVAAGECLDRSRGQSRRSPGADPPSTRFDSPGTQALLAVSARPGSRAFDARSAPDPRPVPPDQRDEPRPIGHATSRIDAARWLNSYRYSTIAPART